MEFGRSFCGVTSDIIVSAANFADVNSNSNANYNSASNAEGVQPI